MAQEYQTIRVTDWRKLKTDDGINGLHIGRVVTDPGPAGRGVEVGGEFFFGPQAIVLLQTCGYAVERPVAEEPEIVTFVARIDMDDRYYDHRLEFGDHEVKGFEPDELLHVTVTEKPHTAVMGKILHSEHPMNGGYVGDYKVEKGMRVIVVDEDS